MLLETVIGLIEFGWTVVVALPSDGPLVALLCGQGARVAVCPTPILRKSVFKPRGAATFVRDVAKGAVQGTRLLRRTRPKLVYVNTITIPLWSILARLSGRATITHVHEAEGKAHPIVRRAINAPLLLATRVIANSHYTVDILSQSFTRLRSRSTVVLNGVPGPVAPSLPRENLAAPVILTYVGRLSPRKGVDVAIDALAHLRAAGIDAELRLIGAVFEGYAWYEDQLRKQVTDLELQDSVNFLGFQERVFDLVQEGDIVLVPSRADEPFGNTAVEALLCQRPVIASATSGLLEATSGYNSARTSEPMDAAAIAETISELIAHWPQVRFDIAQDREVARIRHSPASYRAAINREVGEIVYGFTPSSSTP